MSAVSPMVLVLIGVAVLVGVVFVLGGLGRISLSMEPPHTSLWTAVRQHRADRARRRALAADDAAATVTATEAPTDESGDAVAAAEDPGESIGSVTSDEVGPPVATSAPAPADGSLTGPGSGAEEGPDRPSRDEV